MSREQRQHRRFSVVDLELREKDSGKEIGRIVNLSEGGMLIDAFTELEKDTIISLRVPFSRPVEGEIFYDFRATVAWSIENTPGQYSVGLKILDNSKLQYVFLQKMVAIYGQKSSKE